ncbi:MAG: hypothetical protein JRJ18_06295, partial [Deltaproteobacteria bacterium]|nr:hypothetical protein [Deltaproteobacteria bacterium]
MGHGRHGGRKHHPDHLGLRRGQNQGLPTADAVDGLRDNSVYYVVPDASDPSKLYLAATYADAVAAEPVLIDLEPSSEAGAEHRLYTAAGSYLTFDSVAGVNGDEESITLGSAHGLSAGSQVTYRRVVPYDDAYTVTLSDAERDYYTDYYTAQGLTPTEVADAIQTMVYERTTQYHTLHKTYGDVGNITADPSHYDPDLYDPNWAYDVDDGQLHQTFGSGDVVDSTIDLGVHAFTNGQAVMYHQGWGGAIDGLTDGEIYYVVTDPADPGKIRLAATQADATAPSPVTLSFTYQSGSYHHFSDRDVLEQRAAWSESQLKNSIHASITRPKDVPGTTTTIEEPNIKGQDVALEVSGNIGVAEGQVEIALPVTGALTTEEKLALAAAEKVDVTFYADPAGTIEIEPDDPGADPRLVRIDLKEDVDIEAGGVVSADSGGNMFLGSEGDILIDRVDAGGLARIKGQGGLYDARTGVSGWVNILSGDLILEAEDQSIGTAADPMATDLQTGATLVARAGHDIYLRESDGDLVISEVFSNDSADLRADGSILDAFDDDASTRSWNIYTGTLNLEAGTGLDTEGGIGADGHNLEIDLQTGPVTARADQGIYLHETVGDM